MGIYAELGIRSRSKDRSLVYGDDVPSLQNWIYLSERDRLRLRKRIRGQERVAVDVTDSYVEDPLSGGNWVAPTDNFQDTRLTVEESDDRGFYPAPLLTWAIQRFPKNHLANNKFIGQIFNFEVIVGPLLPIPIFNPPNYRLRGEMTHSHLGGKNSFQAIVESTHPSGQLLINSKLFHEFTIHLAQAPQLIAELGISLSSSNCNKYEFYLASDDGKLYYIKARNKRFLNDMIIKTQPIDVATLQRLQIPGFPQSISFEKNGFDSTHVINDRTYRFNFPFLLRDKENSLRKRILSGIQMLPYKLTKLH